MKPLPPAQNMKHMCKSMLKSFLCFESMLTPWLIQILFWLGLVLIVITTFVNLFHAEFWQALKVLILGPIGLRIACEFFILFFKINDTLTQARNIAQQNSYYLSKMNRGGGRRPHRPQHGQHQQRGSEEYREHREE